MTPPLAIIDANVVVSGLITRDAESPAAVILNAMLGGRLPFLLSPKLLAEYRSVMLRPKITALHGLTEEQIDRILTDIVTFAIWREPKEQSSAPDAGDNHLWALLNAQRGALLVTGDRLSLKTRRKAAPSSVRKHSSASLTFNPWRRDARSGSKTTACRPAIQPCRGHYQLFQHGHQSA